MEATSKIRKEVLEIILTHHQFEKRKNKSKKNNIQYIQTKFFINNLKIHISLNATSLLLLFHFFFYLKNYSKNKEYLKNYELKK